MGIPRPRSSKPCGCELVSTLGEPRRLQGEHLAIPVHMCGVYEQGCGISDTLVVVRGTSVVDVVFTDRIVTVAVEMRSLSRSGTILCRCPFEHTTFRR
jgi:hypothetical protein